MNKLLCMGEKAFRGIRAFSKLSYYKLKYGKNLKIGRNVHFRKGFIINISEQGKVEIGDNTFFNNYCSINCHNKIIIGKNNLFGESVKIYDHNHVFDDKSVNIEKSFRDGQIVIGDKNWFGSNVIILSKAIVGSNNVFGAGVVINSRYDDGLLVKQDNKVVAKKIIYK